MAKSIVSRRTRLIDLTGKRFGRWTVKKRVASYQQTLWMCECECGRIVAVNSGSLRRGLSQSCGCLRREKAILAHYRHGGTGTLENGIWMQLVQRCRNPTNRAYPNYGGRGIEVCERWTGRDGFVNFLADMGKRPSPNHTVDRINNDGHYSPENCRWATRLQQGRNSRKNRLLTCRGETLCISEWSEKTGIKASLISNRLARGWSVEDAIAMQPAQKWYSRRLKE